MAKTLTPAQAKYFGKGRAHPFAKKGESVAAESPRHERTEAPREARAEGETPPTGRRSMRTLEQQIFG